MEMPVTGWASIISESALGTQFSSFHSVYDLIDTVAHDGLAPNALVKSFAIHGIELVGAEGVPWCHDATDVLLLDGAHLPSMTYWSCNGISLADFFTFVDIDTCVSAWALASYYGLHETPVFQTAPTPPASPSTIPTIHPKSLQSMGGNVDKLVLSIQMVRHSSKRTEISRISMPTRHNFDTKD